MSDSTQPESDQRQAAGFRVRLQQQEQLPGLIHGQKPSLRPAALRRPAAAAEAPLQRGGDDRDGAHRRHLHADGRTDGRPAEDERRRVRLLSQDHVTSDLQQLTQLQSLPAAHTLLQSLEAVVQLGL